MGQFQPNPQAEVNAGFDVVRPGVYRMRIKEVTDFTSKAGDPCVKIRLEFVDPSQCFKVDGSPAKNPGNVFDNGFNTTHEKQARLRGLVEACGRDWESMRDTIDLVGCEVDVKLKYIPDGQYPAKNEADRYLAI